MTEEQQPLQRARRFGGVSLAVGLAALLVPWTGLSHGLALVWTSLALGIGGVLLSLPALDARREVEGSKPGVPVAGLVVNLLAIFVCGVIWFIWLALAQHGPR